MPMDTNKLVTGSLSSYIGSVMCVHANLSGNINHFRFALREVKEAQTRDKLRYTDTAALSYD